MDANENPPKMQLPRRIVPYSNADKTGYETWATKGPNPDLLDFPKPFRMCLMAQPNTGKTTIIKNVLAHCYPYFTEIIVVHQDTESGDYDDIGQYEMCSLIPSPEELNERAHAEPGPRLIIIEDIPLGSLDASQKLALDRLFGYCSSHMNYSVMLTAQNWTSLHPTVRRMTNIFVLGNLNDQASMRQLCTRVGCPAKIYALLLGYLKTPHDTMWIDRTIGSPQPYRINGYQIPTVSDY